MDLSDGGLGELAVLTLCDQTLGSSVGTHGDRFTAEEAKYIQRAVPLLASVFVSLRDAVRAEQQEADDCDWEREVADTLRALAAAIRRGTKG